MLTLHANIAAHNVDMLSRLCGGNDSSTQAQTVSQQGLCLGFVNGMQSCAMQHQACKAALYFVTPGVQRFACMLKMGGHYCSSYHCTWRTASLMGHGTTWCASN